MKYEIIDKKIETIRREFFSLLKRCMSEKKSYKDTDIQNAFWEHREEFREMARRIIRFKGMPEDFVLIPDIEDHYYDGGSMVFIPPDTLKVTYRANYEDGWEVSVELYFGKKEVKR